MRSDMTLGEVKDKCTQLTGKYGDKACDQCELSEFGCCDPPDSWKLDAPERCAQPNWEELYEKVRAEAAKMVEEREWLRGREQYLERENEKLRTIVTTVETMLGRKFEV